MCEEKQEGHIWNNIGIKEEANKQFTESWLGT